MTKTVSSLTSRRLDNLARRVRELGLSETELVSRIAGLSGQAERLFLFVAVTDEPVSTIDVRVKCSIGNVSEAARVVNRRLQEAGDPRRVVCERRPHTNQFGEVSELGYWKLAESEVSRACA